MAHILKGGNERMTSIRLRYSHIPLKTRVSKLFYVLHTSACCIFAIARRILTGAPQLLAVRSIDRYLPVRMCRFTAVTGTIITKPTLIQQVNLTSLTLWIFN